jgi:two-component system, chemotaxis family, chemotaxis protein CheY
VCHFFQWTALSGEKQAKTVFNRKGKIMAIHRILSVGQCHADGPAISRAIRKHFTAEVVAVDTAADAVQALRDGGYDLVLVNRIFDMDGGSGLELIKQVKANPDMKATPIMLVSNFPEWQAEAVNAGAVPGFGKNSLGKPAMVEALAKVIK